MPDIPGLFSVSVNSSEVIAMLTSFEEALPAAQAATAAILEAQLPPLIIQVFSDVIATVEGPGFPPQYAEHLLSVVAQLPVAVVFSGYTVSAAFDLSALGSYADFERGFHRGALLGWLHDHRTGSRHNDHWAEMRVVLPYVGQELYNDVEKRYEFWQAVVDGTPYYIESIHQEIDTYGLWEETIDDRVETWGGSAPEWLILVFGSPTYPVVYPTNLYELLYSTIIAKVGAVYAQELATAIQAAKAGVRVVRGKTGRLSEAYETETGAHEPIYEFYNQQKKWNVRGGNLANRGQYSTLEG